MTRFVLFAVMCFSAGIAQAASKQDKLCDDFAYASQQLADLRISGSSKAKAQKIVLGQYEADQVVYVQTIPALADFVYGLSKEDLRSDVEAAFAKQCKGYKG